MTAWSIEGVMLAAGLPSDTFGAVGACSVGPIPTSELDRYHAPDLIVLHPPESVTESRWVATRNQVRFYATHRLHTRLDAEDRDVALAEAETRFRRVAASFAMAVSPVTYPSCSVRITRWARLDQLTGNELETGVPPSFVEGTRPVEILGLDVMSRVIDLANEAQKDEALGRLFDTWYRAEQVYPVASQQDERRWALIEYARLLEDIGQIVADPIDDVEYKNAMARIKTTLKIQIDSDEGDRSILKAAEEIRQARQKQHEPESNELARS